MFHNLKTTLDKVLDLAFEVKKSELDLKTGKFKNKNGYVNGISSERIAFREYLLTLDFETIKILKCIMYIGREKDDFDFTKLPEQNYQEFRDIYDKVPSWSSKSNEISSIEAKLPHLYNYLETGFKLLNI